MTVNRALLLLAVSACSGEAFEVFTDAGAGAGSAGMFTGGTGSGGSSGSAGTAGIWISGGTGGMSGTGGIVPPDAGGSAGAPLDAALDNYAADANTEEAQAPVDCGYGCNPSFCPDPEGGVACCFSECECGWHFFGGAVCQQRQ